MKQLQFGALPPQLPQAPPKNRAGMNLFIGKSDLKKPVLLWAENYSGPGSSWSLKALNVPRLWAPTQSTGGEWLLLKVVQSSLWRAGRAGSQLLPFLLQSLLEQCPPPSCHGYSVTGINLFSSSVLCLSQLMPISHCLLPRNCDFFLFCM